MSYALIENDVTQLCCAIRTGDTSAINILLQAGTDINTPDRNGETALHTAVWTECIDVVQELIDAGVDVNQSNQNGQTPLHIAAGSGNVDITRLLLEAEADTDIQTKYTKMTALHLASQNGHTDIVKTLFDYGADIDTLDLISKSAAFYAANSEIRDILKQAKMPWEQKPKSNNNIMEESELMHKYLGLQSLTISKETAAKEMSTVQDTSVIHRKETSAQLPKDNLLQSPSAKETVMPTTEIQTNIKPTSVNQTNLKHIPVTTNTSPDMKPGFKTDITTQQRPNKNSERGLQKPATSNKVVQNKTETSKKYVQHRPKFSQEHVKIMQMNVFDRLTKKKSSVQK